MIVKFHPNTTTQYPADDPRSTNSVRQLPPTDRGFIGTCEKAVAVVPPSSRNGKVLESLKSGKRKDRRRPPPQLLINQIPVSPLTNASIEVSPALNTHTSIHRPSTHHLIISQRFTARCTTLFIASGSSLPFGAPPTSLNSTFHVNIDLQLQNQSLY